MPSAISKLRVACLQVNAGADWEKNLEKTEKLALQALKYRPHVISLPENFYWRGSAAKMGFLSREVTPRLILAFKELARKHRVAVLLGSLFEPSSQKNKYYNTSVLISEKGSIAARYRKMHLFDVRLNKVNICESKYFVPGEKVVTGKIWNVPVGLSICYDLRFPELFRQMAKRGARIFFLPSNFTKTTGQAHWEILLRARAIENLAFVVAPAQVGTHPSTGIESFGHSMIVDPWGKVLCRASGDREQIVMAELDLSSQKAVQKNLPVLQHRRLD